jgi:2-polyprenyl-3-methyl-5-hydroxy-6-metoxy-1,4-benzoquinol methylase
MTQKAFREAFTAYFLERHKLDDLEDLSEKLSVHLRYGLTTNERAKTRIEALDRLDLIDWRSVRLLDVGCAYGGTCIEAAKRGAQCWGIDIAASYVELAKINAADLELPVHFEVLDVTDRAVRTLVPAGSLDLILVSDVFEHVYDTFGMLENLALLAAPGCRLVYEIPNGQCLDYILKEGHTMAFGLTLLNPFYWRFHPDSSFNIFYRRWDHYLALLKHAGFEPDGDLSSNRQAPTRDGIGDNIRNGLAAIHSAIQTYAAPDLDPSFLVHFQNAFARFEAEALDDLERMEPEQLEWKYLTPFWKGVARLRSSRAQKISPAKPTSAPVRPSEAQNHRAPRGKTGLADRAAGVLRTLADFLQTRR